MAAVGVFDSGVGGLSVLRELHRQLPQHDFIYLADQAHVPYGPRPLNEVRTLSASITQFLLDQGAGTVVVACNTASAAALHDLRRAYPEIDFVGMEPAVKPAAARSEARSVAVLATPATFQGELFTSVVRRFANGIQVTEIVLPGLVEEIEAGRPDSERALAVIADGLERAGEAGADTLVLACTHYSFMIPAIEALADGSYTVIDPAPAIARQTSRLAHPTNGDPGRTRYVTSGDPAVFRSVARKLLAVEELDVERAAWRAGRLTVV